MLLSSGSPYGLPSINRRTMSEVKQAQEDSKDTRLVTNNGPHNELNLGTAGDSDQTAVEDETIVCRVAVMPIS